MIKKSTYTRAYEACEAFFAETGQMPTIDAIKPIIGVNSPSTISSAIKAWKNDLSQTIRKDQGVLPGVPANLTDTVNALWQQALAEARQALRDRSRVVPRSDRACVFTEHSVVKMQALRNRVESLR